MSPPFISPPRSIGPALPAFPSRWNRALVQVAIAVLVIMGGNFALARQPETTSPVPGVATPEAEAASTADWPMYRGNPARTGVMAGLGPDGPPVELWRFQAQGSASRSPAIAAGVAYLQSGDGFVYALDAATGAERWRVDLGGEESTPAVVGDLLYVNDGVGALVALDSTTGTERWRLADDIASGATPIVVDGVLFTASEDGTLSALDAATGTIQWQYASGTGIGRPPAIAGGLIYLGTDDGAVRVVDTTTGEEQWRFESGETDEPARTPTVANGVGYVNIGSTLYALDAATGSEHWRSTFAGARPVTAAGDTLYCAGLDGVVHALDATTGEPQWTFATNDRIQAAPAFIDDTVYVASFDRTLYALDAATGQERWGFALDGVADYGPSIANGVIYISTDAGSLVALGSSNMAQRDAVVTGTGTSTTARPEASGTPAESLAMRAPVEFLWRTTGGPEPPQVMATVAVDPQGRVWIADGTRGQFQIFAPNGTYLETWGVAGEDEGQLTFQRPGTTDALTGIAFAPDGGFYVADSRNSRVQQFDRQRNFVRAWGAFGSGDGQFLEPIGVNVAPDGQVYVLDDKRDDVQVFSADGQFIRTFGGHGAGDGELNFIGWGDVDPEGNFWIADTGNNRIQQFAPDGTFMQAIDHAGATPLTGPQALAVDDTGRVFVADTGNRRVVALDATGHMMASWSGDDAGGTAFANIVFVALDGLGTIYVHDYSDDDEAVQKFRLLPPLAP